MAIYHLSVQVIGRSSGRSSVAAAAYRGAERIVDDRTGLAHDFSRRREKVETHIYAPEGAPEWVRERSRLWNHVEAVEKRRDAQVAREINIALPKELSAEQQSALVRGYVREQFVNRGMVADVAIHRGNPENPHAHIMLTTRGIGPDGFGPKNRDWNRPELLEQWRASWAEHVNRELERERLPQRVDHRSLEAQGIHDREPQIHEGPHARALERNGLATERGEINREVRDYNTVVIDLEKAREDRRALLAEKAVADRMEDRLRHGWPEVTAKTLAAAERSRGGREITEADTLARRDELHRQLQASQEAIKVIEREGRDVELSRQRLADLAAAEKALRQQHTALNTVRRWVSEGTRNELKTAQRAQEAAQYQVNIAPIKTESELAVRQTKATERKAELPRLSGRVDSVISKLNTIANILDGFQKDLRRQRERQQRERDRYEREQESRERQRSRERGRER